MAPRKGGGSSSSSSGGGGGITCYGCNRRYTLAGSYWGDPSTNAIFAFYIIASMVLLACLVLASKFRWVRKAGKDKLRNLGFVVATCFVLLYLVITIVNSALHERRTRVTYLYYITYIFVSLGWRIGEVLILAIVVRTLYESSASTLVNVLPIINKITVLLLSILSTAAFGLYIAETALTIIDGQPSYYRHEQNLLQNMGYVDFSYTCLYFVVSLLVVVYAVLLYLKERSRATTVIVAGIAPALFLRTLIDLAIKGVGNFPRSTSRKVYEGLRWADNYIYVIMTTVIFLLVAIVGCMAPRYLDSTLEQPKQYGNTIPIEYTHNGPPTAFQSIQPMHQKFTPTTYGNGEAIHNGSPVAQQGPHGL